MRRNTILAVILLLRLYSLANEPIESKTRYYRHEVNVSIGRIGVRSGWSNDYENDVMNRFGLVVGRAGGGHGPGTGIVYEQKDKPNLGTDNPLKTVSYYYHFNHHVAVGGLFGFCNVQDWLGYPEVNNQGEAQKTGYTYVKGSSLFIMPSAKWSWLNYRWYSLYMKASAGFHRQKLYLNSETIPSEETDEYKKKHWGFAYYVTPFGWEIGRQKVRWFMEIGIGTNTNFQTGLMYRFGRY